jgi:hypothetical protein
MPTTTFADIRFTETVEHRYEGENYTFEEGCVYALPRHTAGKFVNNWGRAEWTTRSPYEVKDIDYDDVLCREREADNEDEDAYGYRELQQLAKDTDIAANQPEEELREALEEEGVIEG